jgi:hypothetical protein
MRVVAGLRRLESSGRVVQLKPLDRFSREASWWVPANRADAIGPNLRQRTTT